MVGGELTPLAISVTCCSVEETEVASHVSIAVRCHDSCMVKDPTFTSHRANINVFRLETDSLTAEE